MISTPLLKAKGRNTKVATSELIEQRKSMKMKVIVLARKVGNN
jgi:hypothetical protein